MELSRFYEAVLDNLTDGVYVLDDRGNYIFGNSTYLQKLNISRDTLLSWNVYRLLEEGTIDVCISDRVYREKRRVVMFQDVYGQDGLGQTTFRQMVISTPIFNEAGEVQNILAITRPLDDLNQLYYEASLGGVAQASARDAQMLFQDTDLIAVSPAMQNVLEMARMVAGVDSAVLITGESGTGKEVIAEYLHRAGSRAKRPLVVINCASLPENLLEAELFGYERGAFTGAAPGGKRGLFEEADGGTLFLDEINSLPLNLQGKLLRAIETKTIQHLGSAKTIRVNFRLVSATNENLEQLMAEKLFRPDLYYRLNVIPMALPPLRERKEDIIPLANHFLRHFCQKHRKNKVFSPKTLKNMEDYDWPGNVRQLKNFVERAVVMSLDEVIEITNIAVLSGSGNRPPTSPAGFTASSLPAPAAALAATPPASPLPSPASAVEISSDVRLMQLLAAGVSLSDFVGQCEKEYLRCALQQYPTSYKAAAALGTSQASIIRRKQKYGL